MWLLNTAAECRGSTSVTVADSDKYCKWSRQDGGAGNSRKGLAAHLGLTKGIVHSKAMAGRGSSKFMRAVNFNIYEKARNDMQPVVFCVINYCPLTYNTCSNSHSQGFFIFSIF